MPPQTARNACHNCRRQRRKCDRSEPHCAKCASRGIQCLGYGQLLLWTGSAASRGKQAGDTSVSSMLRDLSTQPATTELPHNPQDIAVNTGGFSGSAPRNEPVNQQSQLVRARRVFNNTPTPRTLIDPLFQDLKPSYRCYLDYFSSRVCLDLVAHDTPDHNPFRNLIPLAHTHTLLREVIVAASAAHMCNQTRALQAVNRFSEVEVPGHWEMDALVAKQKALHMMPAALESIDTIGGDVILAVALFLVNAELIESGKNGWRPHLEGTRNIMSLLQPLAAVDETWTDYVMSDCIVYHILHSAFAPSTPDLHTKHPSLDPMSILRKTKNSYFCCPPEVLEVVHLASHMSRSTGENALSEHEHLSTGFDLLHRSQSVDVLAWALKARDIPGLETSAIGSRYRAGSAHRLAACLYVMQAVPSLQRSMGQEVVDVIMDDLHHALEAVPLSDSNFKSTAWPTFIFGATAKSIERKAWVVDRLRRLAVAYPWGYLNTTMDTLEILWSLEAEGKLTKGWLPTLQDPEHNILVV